eukprot:Clim_evm54s253 gene=Clim_evmTU54s253
MSNNPEETPPQENSPLQNMFGDDDDDEEVIRGPTTTEGADKETAEGEAPAGDENGNDDAVDAHKEFFGSDSESDDENDAAAGDNEEDKDKRAEIDSGDDENKDKDVERRASTVHDDLGASSDSSDNEFFTSHAQAGADYSGHHMAHIEEKTIDMTLPLVQIPLKDAMYYCRLPDFMEIQHRPFESDKFEALEGPDLTEAELYRRLSLTIRWQLRKANNESDPDEKVSNARLVTWEDGSMHLKIGNEYLAVDRQRVRGDDSTQLFFKTSGNAWLGQRVLRERMNIRPITSKLSRTPMKERGRVARQARDGPSKRNLSAMLADRSNPTAKAKVQVMVGGDFDPHEDMMNAMKQEKMKERASRKRENTRNRMLQETRFQDVSADYLDSDEDVDDDEDEVGDYLAKKKRRAMRGLNEDRLVAAKKGQRAAADDGAGSSSDDDLGEIAPRGTRGERLASRRARQMMQSP